MSDVVDERIVSLTVEIEKLKSANEQIIRETAASNARESFTTRLFFFIFSILIGVATYVNYRTYQESSTQAANAIDRVETRVADLVERSESYIERLSGGAVPQTVRMHGILGESDRAIGMHLGISTSNGGGIRTYRLEAKGKVQGTITGPVGRLIGNRYSLSGPLADVMTLGPNDLPVDRRREELKVGSFSTEGRGNGMLVSEGTPFDFNVSYSNVFMTCSEVEGQIDRLLNFDGEQGIVTVMPVFERIAVSPSKPFEFEVQLIRGQGFTCEELDAATINAE